MMEQSYSFLIFRSQESLYALKNSCIETIIFLPQITPFSEMTGSTIGCINYHGEVMPVIDINLFLGNEQKKYTRNDYVVVFRENLNVFGVIISTILDVKELKAEQVEISDHLDALDFFSLWQEEIVYVIDFEVLKKKIEKKEQVSHTRPMQNIREEDLSLFIERAKSLAKPPFREENVNTIVLSVIQVNKEFYGLDPKYIKEYAILQDLTPIPCSPAYLLGFFNLRGSILPILDIWLWMGMQAIELKKGSKVMVIHYDELTLGLVIDEIIDVTSFPEAQFQLHSLKEATSTYISQTTRYENSVLGILDIKKIMESYMMQSMEKE